MTCIPCPWLDRTLPIGAKGACRIPDDVEIPDCGPNCTLPVADGRIPCPYSEKGITPTGVPCHSAHIYDCPEGVDKDCTFPANNHEGQQ